MQHHLSRRFSGYVYLYVAIASIVTQAAYLVIANLPFVFGNVNYTLFRLVSLLLIFLPPLIFIAVRKYPLARVLRLNTFPMKHSWYAIGLGVCVFLFLHMVTALLNSLYASVVSQIEINAFYIFGKSFHSIWPYVLTSCLIPALLEVPIYQGAVYSGLHAVKPLKACLLVGLLQGLVVVGSNATIGASVWTIIYYAILGFTISYIALQSGSILPAILASFVYYLLSYADLEDLFYQYILSPLGVSQTTAAIGLLIIAGVLGLLLMLKLPNVKAENRPLRWPSFKGLRQKLTQPYIPAPKDEASDAKETLPETAEPEEDTVSETDELPEDAALDPGDTAKRRNLGFILGSALLGALTLASLIYFIVMIVTEYSYQVY